jgi:hypothetical protein
MSKYRMERGGEESREKATWMACSRLNHVLRYASATYQTAANTQCTQQPVNKKQKRSDYKRKQTRNRVKGQIECSRTKR